MKQATKALNRASHLGWQILKHATGIDLPVRLAQLAIHGNLNTWRRMTTPATAKAPASFAALGLGEAEIRPMNRRCVMVFYAAAAVTMLWLGLLGAYWLEGSVLPALGAAGGVLIGLSLCLQQSLVSAQLRTRTLLSFREWVIQRELWLPRLRS